MTANPFLAPFATPFGLPPFDLGFITCCIIWRIWANCRRT